MSFALMLVAATLPSQAAPTPDPLAPAASGMLQCYAPDLAKHACQSLAGYRKRADGSYDNAATIMLSPSPLLIMETETPVTVDAGAVCGAIREQDIDTAVISVNGQKMSDADAVVVRSQIATGMAFLIGKRICTKYVPDGAQLIAKATIDGEAQPAMDQKVIWVAPTDGFHVGP
ncbi:MAG: hypothetical protein ABIO86_19770 [Sphingomonas sp.]